MRFQHGFTVAAPIEDVWEALMDVERSATCMPGTEVLERNGDNGYRIRVSLKLGPLAMHPRAQLRIVERDDLGHRATFTAVASEEAGAGSADARARLSLGRTARGTEATIETELQLTGTAAVVGRRVVAELAAVLVQAFAANLERMLAQPSAPGVAAPLPVAGVAATLIGSRLRDIRMLAAAALLGVAIGYLIGRRRLN